VVVSEERSVDHSRHPIAGIAAAYGNVAIDQADTSDATLQIVGILRANGGKTACEN
jgi:hypothetical protein